VAHEDRLHDDRVLLQGRHQPVVDLRRRVDHLHHELDAELRRRRLNAGDERLGVLIARPADEGDRLQVRHDLAQVSQTFAGQIRSDHR
jgi:hypothetical protein